MENLTTAKHKNTYLVELRINDQITEVKMCSDKFDKYLGKRKTITLYTSIK